LYIEKGQDGVPINLKLPDHPADILVNIIRCRVSDDKNRPRPKGFVACVVDEVCLKKAAPLA
jgi:hypothetical protein